MALYDLGRLIADVVRTRGPLLGQQLQSKRGGGYEQVWDAFNRYLSDVMGKRQTLGIPGFGKIGWRIEEHSQGRAKMRPHFQVTEAFAKAYGLDVRAHPLLADRVLAHVEELHFSKAAIRYTQSLTKDGIYLGLRSIFAAIGEACGNGQQVSVDFEVGRLTCADRVLRFDFLADLYVKEGLDVPSNAPQEGQYKPSATFTQASPEAAATLNLAGKADGFSTPIKAHASQLGGGWAEFPKGGAMSSTAPVATLPPDQASSPAPWATSAVMQPISAPSSGSYASSGLHKKEHVQNEALGRHLAKMEAEAAQAIEEKESWEEHLRRIGAEAAREVEYRRALAKDHQTSLKDQMFEAELKRIEHRQNIQEMASAHDFPNFTHCPEMPVYDGLRADFKFREGLDEQVQRKARQRMEREQQELQQETVHLEATRKDLAIRRLETMLKKENEKAALHESWERDKRIRSVKKAIEEYHKTPAKKSPLSAMGGASGSPGRGGFAESGGSGAQSARGRMSSTMPAFREPQLGASSPLPSARSQREAGVTFDGESVISASMPPSRPVTGAVRRVPFGAAASLALHKEKIGASLRR